MYMYCLSGTEVSLQMGENGREAFHVSMVLNIPQFLVDYHYLPTYLPAPRSSIIPLLSPYNRVEKIFNPQVFQNPPDHQDQLYERPDSPVFPCQHWPSTT